MISHFFRPLIFCIPSLSLRVLNSCVSPFRFNFFTGLENRSKVQLPKSRVRGATLKFSRPGPATRKTAQPVSTGAPLAGTGKHRKLSLYRCARCPTDAAAPIDFETAPELSRSASHRRVSAECRPSSQSIRAEGSNRRQFPELGCVILIEIRPAPPKLLELELLLSSGFSSARGTLKCRGKFDLLLKPRRYRATRRVVVNPFLSLA